jgi:hypothetical protein
LHPDLAAGALQYRLDRLAPAVARSREYGYEGAQWPWESAFSGVDTVQAPNIEGQFEHHIAGDVAMALRQYWLATQDRGWLAAAWPALNATCVFWACRLVRQDAPEGPPGCGAKAGAANFTVRRSQGPDENAGVVDDQLYTVAIAASSLDFCVAAGALLGEPVPAAWAEMAANAYLPLDSSLFAGGPVHPEYRGYAGQHINQADVALLQFPLGREFDAAVMRNDLDFYSALTGARAESGGIVPFFTGNSAYSIAYLALGNRTAADAQFELAFLHQEPPFLVWTETIASAGFGHLHFITGAGGWMQSFLYGYSGLRLPAAGGQLRFATPAPVLPPGGATGVRLRGLHLLGAAFDFSYNGTTICVALNPTSPAGAPPLQLRVEASGQATRVAAEERCVALGAVVVERAA